MLTAAIPTEFREKLSDMANNADVQHMELQGLLDEDTLSALAFLNEDPDTKKAAAFATYYLACVKENKGEHAFDLAHILKDNLLKPESERNSLKIPTHVEEAISWARRAESGEANS
jgi:hypothetical protein